VEFIEFYRYPSLWKIKPKNVQWSCIICTFNFANSNIHAHKKIENKNFTDVMECWTSFSTADCTMYIKQAMDAIKPGTANACQQNLRNGCEKDFNHFPTTDNELRCTVHVARQVECDAFVCILEEEIQELIETHQETLTNYIIYVYNT
jgi:hypothetical protein